MSCERNESSLFGLFSVSVETTQRVSQSLHPLTKSFVAKLPCRYSPSMPFSMLLEIFWTSCRGDRKPRYSVPYSLRSNCSHRFFFATFVPFFWMASKFWYNEARAEAQPAIDCGFLMGEIFLPRF